MTQPSATPNGHEKDPVPTGEEAVRAYFAAHTAAPSFGTINMGQRIHNRHWDTPSVQALAIRGVVQAMTALATAEPDRVPGIARWVCEKQPRRARALRPTVTQAFANLLEINPTQAMKLALWADTNLPKTFRPAVESTLRQGAGTLAPEDNTQLAREVRERCKQITPCPRRGTTAVALSAPRPVTTVGLAPGATAPTAP